MRKKGRGERITLWRWHCGCGISSECSRTFWMFCLLAWPRVGGGRSSHCENCRAFLRTFNPLVSRANGSLLFPLIGSSYRSAYLDEVLNDGDIASFFETNCDHSPEAVRLAMWLSSLFRTNQYLIMRCRFSLAGFTLSPRYLIQMCFQHTLSFWFHPLPFFLVSCSYLLLFTEISAFVSVDEYGSSLCPVELSLKCP